MNILFLDFETYYDSSYSLSKLPIWQYVRDPRFRTLGCAVAKYDASIQFLPAGELQSFFSNLPPTTQAVAHNAMFDGAVLSHHYNFYPSYWYDTQLMMRYAISQGWLSPDSRTGLPEKIDPQADLSAYACNDVRQMIKLFVQFYPRIPREELDIMNLHIKMATEPRLALNTQLLAELASAKPNKIAAFLRKNTNFAKILQQYGIHPQEKISERTGKPTYAFAKSDAFMRYLQNHPNEKIRRLYELRTSGTSHILHTRAQRMLDIGEPFPVPLQYYGAHTGRASGSQKLNLQNLPRKSLLRRALRAPAGHKLVVADLSQIEVRVLAWLANDPNLLHIFRTNKDPYISFASEVMFNKPEEEITEEERRIAKPPVLACGFGQGANGLQQYAANMGVYLSAQQAEQAVRAYRIVYSAVPQFWTRLWQEVMESGQIKLPTGRLLIYPDMYQQGREVYYKRPIIFSKQRKDHRDDVKIWPGLLCENAVQATARDVVMWQSLQIAKHYKVVLSVHDEVVICVKDAEADEALMQMNTIFRTAPPWADGLPIDCESEAMNEYK